MAKNNTPEQTPTIRPDTAITRPATTPAAPIEAPNGSGIVKTQTAPVVDGFRGSDSDIASVSGTVDALITPPPAEPVETVPRAPATSLQDIPRVDSSLSGRARADKSITAKLVVPAATTLPPPTGSKALQAAYQQSATLTDINNFQRGPMLHYMRKTLTLGYQRNLLAKDQLALLQTIGGMLEAKLEAIKLNTAAPDNKKRTLMEEILGSLRAYGIKRVTEHIGGNIERAITPYLKKGGQAVFRAWDKFKTSDRASADVYRRGRDKVVGISDALKAKMSSTDVDGIADKLADFADLAVNKTAETKDRLTKKYPGIGENATRVGDAVVGMYSRRGEFYTRARQVKEKLSTKDGRAELRDQAAQTFNTAAEEAQFVLDNLKTPEGRARLKRWATVSAKRQQKRLRKTAAGAIDRFGKSGTGAYVRGKLDVARAYSRNKLDDVKNEQLRDIIDNIDTVEGRAKLRQRFKDLRSSASDRLDAVKDRIVDTADRTDGLIAKRRIYGRLARRKLGKKAPGIASSANRAVTAIEALAETAKTDGVVATAKNQYRAIKDKFTTAGMAPPASDSAPETGSTSTTSTAAPRFSAYSGGLPIVNGPTSGYPGIVTHTQVAPQPTSPADAIVAEASRPPAGTSPEATSPSVGDNPPIVSSVDRIKARLNRVRERIATSPTTTRITETVDRHRSVVDDAITRMRSREELNKYRSTSDAEKAATSPVGNVDEFTPKLETIRERIDHWGEKITELLKQQLEAHKACCKNSGIGSTTPNADGTAQRKGFLGWARNLPGRALNAVKSAPGAVLSGAWSGTKFAAKTYAKAVVGMAMLPVKITRGLFARRNTHPFTDIYRADRPNKPLVTAKQLEAGLIFEDGRPVINVNKIDRPVLDPTTKQPIITAEDVAAGLTDHKGKPLAKRKSSTSVAGAIGSAIGGAVGGGLKGAAHITTGLGRPALGAIGTMAKYGTLGAAGLGMAGIGAAGGLGYAALRAVPSVAGLASAVLGPMAGLYASALKGAGNLALGGAKGLLGAINPFKHKTATGDLTKDDIKKLVTNRLDDIYDLLTEHFANTTVKGDADGDGIRDGSYADRVRKMANDRRARLEKDSVAPMGGGLGLGRLGTKAAAALAALGVGARGMFGPKSQGQDASSSDGPGLGTAAAGAAAGTLAAGRLAAAKKFGGSVLKGALTGGGRLGKIGRLGAAGLAAYEGYQHLMPNGEGPQQVPPPPPPPDEPMTKAEAIGGAAIGAGTTLATAGLGKLAAKEAAEAAGKTALKKIPVVGAGAGAVFAVNRLMDGDIVGAGGELAAGLVSIVPGVGTGASLAIDAWLGYRDYTKATDPRSKLTMARLTAYGVDKSIYEYTLALEKSQSEYWRTNKLLTPAEYTSMASKFGFDTRSAGAVAFFTAWYEKKFTPLLLAYEDCLKKEGLTYKTADQANDDQVTRILDNYQKVTKELISKYKDFVPTMTAYNAMVASKGTPQTKPMSAVARDVTYDPVGDAAKLAGVAQSMPDASGGSSGTSGATAGGSSNGAASATGTGASPTSPSADGSTTSASTTSSTSTSVSSSVSGARPTNTSSSITGMATGLMAAAGGVGAAANTNTPPRPPASTSTPSSPGPSSSGAAPGGTGSVASGTTGGGGGSDSGDYLGSLSAKYEAKGKSETIGWDSTGGTSYGKYQLAGLQGSADEFVKFLRKKGGDAAVVADRLEKAGPAETGSTKGARPDEWRRIAKEGGLKNYEYDYIKASAYDPQFKRLRPEVQELLRNNVALQKVFWSTVVQHWGHAPGIFNKTFYPGQSLETYIAKIYDERSTRFGSSKPEVRQSIITKRFPNEKKDAIALLNSSGNKPSVPTQTAAAGNTGAVAGPEPSPMMARDTGGSSGAGSDKSKPGAQQTGGASPSAAGTSGGGGNATPTRPSAVGSPASSGGSGGQMAALSASDAATSPSPSVPNVGLNSSGTSPSAPATTSTTSVTPSQQSTPSVTAPVTPPMQTGSPDVVKAITTTGEQQARAQAELTAQVRALVTTLSTSLGEGGTVVSAMQRPNVSMSPVVNQSTVVAPGRDDMGLDTTRKAASGRR